MFGFVKFLLKYRLKLTNVQKILHIHILYLMCTFNGIYVLVRYTTIITNDFQLNFQLRNIFEIDYRLYIWCFYQIFFISLSLECWVLILVTFKDLYFNYLFNLFFTSQYWSWKSYFLRLNILIHLGLLNIHREREKFKNLYYTLIVWELTQAKIHKYLQ